MTSTEVENLPKSVTVIKFKDCIILLSFLTAFEERSKVKVLVIFVSLKTGVLDSVRDAAVVNDFISLT